MLHLYQANRLETLLELLLAVIRQPLPSPFEPEVVVVQSKGMARWITLQLAKRNGICANLQFPLPATFIWQLFRAMQADLPRRSGFSPDIMAWRIAEQLASPEVMALHPSLHHYLQQPDERRRYELAWQVADIFDHYLMYRPDWIEAWEQGRQLGLGEEERWQQPLWQRLAAQDSAPHRVRLLQHLLDRLAQGERPAHLPQRVILFGISAMPPAYVDILHGLSQQLDVCLFVLNPCQEAWGHLTRQPPQLDLLLEDAGPARPEDLYLDLGHPLLASLGRQGRDFMDMLVERHSGELHDLFVENEQPTLLARLQNDILYLREPAADHVLAEDDVSIQHHLCHSPMRELEVLHDQLLQLFEADPTLQPADVAVLMPDIHTYAPLIDAVFARREGVPYIPYGIADRSLLSQWPLLQVVEQLLQVAAGRFAAAEVLDLLSCPALARCFGIEEAELPLLRQWVEAAAIRWARDARHKVELGLPDDPAHSWQQGLDRLLLGVALPVELAEAEVPLFAGMLPVAVAEGSKAQLLARLAMFVEQLGQLHLRVAEPLSAADWVAQLHQVLEQFFEPDEDEQQAVQHLRDTLAQLLEDTTLAGFGQTFGLPWLRRWLQRHSSQAYGSTGFLSGGVTFCAMVPMRSLPFRVLCLLGLNDGDFPRQLRPQSFDLVAQHYRRGDRSRRFDDRYLFLEALLSARQVLYLSHVGFSIRDGQSLPPSPLLAELLDVIRLSCADPDALSRVTLAHPLQPFDARLFQPDAGRLRSYAAPYARAGVLAGLGEGSLAPLFQQPLPVRVVDSASLEEWLQCFRNPARYLLRERLSIWLDEPRAEPEGYEPFELDWHARQALRRWLQQAQGRPWGDAETVQCLVEADGLLPAGPMGGLMYQAERATLQPFLQALPGAAETLPPLPFHWQGQQLRLQGVLGQGSWRLTPSGLLGLRADRLRPADEFLLWIQHLLLCVLQPQDVACQSRWLAHDERNGAQWLQFERVAEPEPLLLDLEQAFSLAGNQPLPFFIKSAHAWFVAQQQGKDAMKAAERVWLPPEHRHPGQFGEGEQAYYRLLYRDHNPLEQAFCDWAQRLLAPMFAHREVSHEAG